jgi:hypothetical protein
MTISPFISDAQSPSGAALALWHSVWFAVFDHDGCGCGLG